MSLIVGPDHTEVIYFVWMEEMDMTQRGISYSKLKNVQQTPNIKNRIRTIYPYGLNIYSDQNSNKSTKYNGYLNEAWG